MKTTILSLFSIFLVTSTFGQLKISLGGFFSTPLEQFHIDDYSDGGGFDLGFSIAKSIDSTYSVEGGVGFEWGLNGFESTELSLGDYDLKNNFFNWKVKLNLVKRIGNLSPYIGGHIGIGKYYTSEYISFNNLQEDGYNYYDNEMYQAQNFQRGIQLGTYIHLSKQLMLDFGVTINKTDTKVKYIDFASFSYDGSEIDYNEINSSPFMLLFHVGIAFTFPASNTNSSYSKYSNSSYQSSNTNTSCSKTKTKTSSTSQASSNDHYKKNKNPTLIKNGKTPVGFK